MKFADLFQETLFALLSNKVRSGLTILGIVIGIASVIAMVSIGQGAQQSIQSSIEGLGSNLLAVLPGIVQPGRGIVSAGRGSAETLKKEDVTAIEQLDGIAVVSPELSRRFQVTSDAGNNTNITITGATDAYAIAHNLSTAEGAFISADNVRDLGRQAVLGATAAQDLFGGMDPLGRTIRMNNSGFKVVGVLQSKGGAGFSGPDDMVFIPLSTMQKVVSGSDSYSTIVVSVASKDQMTDVQNAINDTLLARHHVASPDFSIISQQDILGTLSTVISTFTLFLASIAGISLVVGGIGIMNMMLTTVTERTREIGLRKAIGANGGDIRLQFLVEAILLTSIGGAIGILLGTGVAYFGGALVGIATQISWFSVILAVGVSAGIGVAFGYYPASRAARLNPIEALRYE